MTYEEFKKAVLEMLPEYLPEDIGANLTTRTVMSTNDTIREAITPGVGPNGGTAPVIYLTDIYKDFEEKDAAIEVVCKAIANTVMTAREQTPEMESISSQIVPESVFPALINLERNKEYLKSIPHLVLGDLAIVYKIPVSDERMGEGMVTVNENVMRQIGLSEDRLHEVAYDNMLSKNLLKIQGIETVLGFMDDHGESKLPISFDDLSALSMDSPMYVISNDQKFWGDGMIMADKNIEKLAEALESSVVFIPSSIHEILAVPDNSPDLVGNCLRMVVDVNSTMDPKEVLSDSIYRYDRERGALEMHRQDGTVKDIEIETPDEPLDAGSKKMTDHVR